MKSKKDVLARLKKNLEEILLGVRRAEKIADTALILRDLGLDSLDYASLLLNMEQWLDLQVKEEGVDWSKIQSVMQLAEFLYKQQGE